MPPSPAYPLTLSHICHRFIIALVIIILIFVMSQTLIHLNANPRHTLNKCIGRVQIVIVIITTTIIIIIIVLSRLSRPASNVEED